MIPIKIDSAWKGTSDCRSCGIRDMVLFADLKEQDFGEIHTPIDDMVFAVDATHCTEDQSAVGGARCAKAWSNWCATAH